MLKKVCPVLLAVIVHGSAYAFSMSDCVLQGMKGVSSDVAARAVKEACADKRRAAQAQTIAALTREYGEEVRNSTIELAKRPTAAGSGAVSIQATNRATGSATVRYAKLTVAPSVNGYCDYSRRVAYAYKLALSQGKSINLKVPQPAEQACFEVAAVRATPGSWTDLSFAGSVEPLSKDPFDDPELLPNYGVASPAPAPSAPSAAPGYNPLADAAPAPIPIPPSLPPGEIDYCKQWVDLSLVSKAPPADVNKAWKRCQAQKADSVRKAR